MPQLLHMGASFGTGDPAACRTDAGTRGRVRRRNFPIERHSRLQCDQRRFMDNVLGEGLVQLARLTLEQSTVNLDGRAA